MDVKIQIVTNLHRCKYMLFSYRSQKAAKSNPALFHSQSKGGDAMSDYEILSTKLMVTLIIVTLLVDRK